MKALIHGSFVALSCFMMSNTGFAIFDAELLVGKRSYTYTQDSSSSTTGAMEYKASAHLELPIPTILIGFGPTISSLDIDKKDSYFKTQGLMAGLEVIAGIAIPATSFTPYAKVAYYPYGVFNSKGDISSPSIGVTTIEGKYEVTGTHISLGVKYDLVPLIDLLLEFDIGSSDKFKAKKVTYNGVDLGSAGTSDYTAKSTGILLGAAIGI